ncbi:tRNA (guanosine(46)-N7)-methyltransferase TrmB [Brachybacterium saurashtrense]|uniref:tRNA (guanine-N(7)-)-methyltransferase n=1 Tax=Brachybacterium saurashtrense TaxID=556288 RepID=A0A345YKQ3_9MICO|nr:tRNA (guanosine(46)-N7)-methyltransferase TrmB [Brachybacterium saurashtrense]AXK44505.1 tRNA (guanosine(46)-N7)-methyltransferase TrmB [Brachybacterium saurashtrense]RRR23117.1 tRNA (guanosine(46)-N7)-methyltransferase TrmB [Brachybacterium saurashtrense]
MSTTEPQDSAAPSPARTTVEHRAEDGATPRDVVSFVRRGERLSQGHQNAWNRLSATYVIDPPRGSRDTLPADGVRLDPEAEFGRRAELVVEVGSGLGDNLVAAALAHPERDHLGVEVYLPGLAQTLSKVERAGCPENLRLLPLDAQRALPAMLPAASISQLWVYFADPWPKSRHHKRRLINPPFLDAVLPLLADGGAFRLATDWAQYAHHMRRVLDARPELALLHPDGLPPTGEASDRVPENMAATGWAPRFEGRVKTGFEGKGIEAGRLIWDLAYTRVPRQPVPDGASGPESPTQ